MSYQMLNAMASVLAAEHGRPTRPVRELEE
jgi:hypothetical protein